MFIPSGRPAPARDQATNRVLALLTGLGAIGTAATGGRGRLGAITSGIATGAAGGLRQNEAAYQDQVQGYEEWLRDVQEGNHQLGLRESLEEYRQLETDYQRRLTQQDALANRGRESTESDRRASRDHDLYIERLEAQHALGLREEAVRSAREAEEFRARLETQLKADKAKEEWLRSLEPTPIQQAELEEVRSRIAENEAQSRSADALATQRLRGEKPRQPLPSAVRLQAFRDLQAIDAQLASPDNLPAEVQKLREERREILQLLGEEGRPYAQIGELGPGQIGPPMPGVLDLSRVSTETLQRIANQ